MIERKNVKKINWSFCVILCEKEKKNKGQFPAQIVFFTFYQFEELNMSGFLSRVISGSRAVPIFVPSRR